MLRAARARELFFELGHLRAHRQLSRLEDCSDLGELLLADVRPRQTD
jgi:hypothetical protein